MQRAPSRATISVLPDDIRALAWRAVVPEFSARFSCASRTYRYFFSRESPKTSEPYDIDAMRDAAARLVGDHDFRNFCKMDIGGGVTNYRRNILSFSIDRLHPARTASLKATFFWGSSREARILLWSTWAADLSCQTSRCGRSCARKLTTMMKRRRWRVTLHRSRCQGALAVRRRGRPRAAPLA